MAKCANYRKCITFPSIQKLMKLTGLSRRQVFSHLQSLRAAREIESLGVLPGCGAGVFHLCKFCATGSDKGVLFSALRCPHVRAVQGFTRGVRKTAYIREKEGEEGMGVRKARQSSPPDGVGLRIPPAVIQKAKGANGHGKLWGNDLLEYNLRILAQTN
jgi:hypothetical protein